MKNRKFHWSKERIGRKLALACALVSTCLVGSIKAQTPGDLDPSFNGTGYAWADLVWEDHVEDIIVTSNGIIYVAGYTTNSLFTQAYVASFLPDGSLNETFNLVGKKIFHFGTGTFSKAHGLCVQADGKILIAGEHAASDANESVRRFGLARLEPDGSFDDQFYQTGRRTYSPVTNQTEHSWGNKIKLGPDGKIYVLGVNGGTTNNQAVIAKFQ
ncbi:MAG: hypothetical protein KA408_15275 [Flavobacteriales bacterium]|nr:hypothetical protein [Flavobacteriales bacterium]